MNLAPIVLFVYNRPEHTLKVLEAVSKNELANQSILYVYADGPKNFLPETIEKIKDVRAIIRRKQWCKEVIIIESDINRGLADSIVNGVNEVVNKHGRVIVLEDDIITSPGFLRFMNDALAFYEDNESIFHISGYMYPHESKLPETFFFNVPLCWGWATWGRAWKYFNVNTDQLLEYLDSHKAWDAANKFGGDFLGNQLRDNRSGKLTTWFIKWHVSSLIHKGYTLYPGLSLVNNIGFDNSGVHNKATEKYDHKKLASRVKVSPIAIEENELAERIIQKFYATLSEKKIKQKKLVNGFISKFFPTGFVLKHFKSLILKAYPELRTTTDKRNDWNTIRSSEKDVSYGRNSKVVPQYHLSDVIIGNYTYIASGANISLARVGKFCSIGPNFMCGWGIHPTNGISTSPMFYSTKKQNDVTLSAIDKFTERKPIYIGNDVFIGANVTVLDGVRVGDGAVIGAGAVVSKDIPPYAIAFGCPIKVIRYRFDGATIEKLRNIQWWNWPDEKLRLVESNFFDIDEFIKLIETKN